MDNLKPAHLLAINSAIDKLQPDADKRETLNVIKDLLMSFAGVRYGNYVIDDYDLQRQKSIVFLLHEETSARNGGELGDIKRRIISNLNTHIDLLASISVH